MKDNTRVRDAKGRFSNKPRCLKKPHSIRLTDAELEHLQSYQTKKDGEKK